MPESVALLVGTRKGAFVLRGDAARRGWELEGPHFLGCSVHHMVQDPREPEVVLMGARTGHLGPTVLRSGDGARTWTEAERPPAFARVADGSGRAVHHVFWLTPGHADEPGVWYAGTSPQGLFRSEDGGVTWTGVAGFNDDPRRTAWCDPDVGRFGTPDGPKLHSLLVDPRDPAHLYLGLSAGGTFESTDRGASWSPLNRGVRAEYLPEPYPEFGQNPHRVELHPLRPDRLYQANHCGTYRLDRPADRWVRIGAGIPSDVGDVGFPIVLHPRDPDTVWIVPMRAGDVRPRTSPDGRPAVYRTRDAGATWERQDAGLPPRHAWWSVKRQAFAADRGDPVGLYLGNTNGEIWQSRDEGASWENVLRHLPHVYSVTTAQAGGAQAGGARG